MSPEGAQKRDRRRWFGAGFRQRNPLVLAAAAALAVAVLFALQGAVHGGGLTMVDEERLLRITHDDYLHVSYRVAELRRDPPTTRTIYLFGGSGTMECIVSEESLAAAVADGSGAPTQVVSLAAHQQSMAMSLALIDNLPPGPAVMAIGLAPIRVTGAPERDEKLLAGRPLLVRSPRLAALAPRLYGTEAPASGVLPGVFSYLGSYLRERPSSGVAWGGRLRYETHYYPPGAKGHLPLGKRRNVLYVLEKDVRLYRKYADYNFAVLEEILKLARERGYSVVLYDQPLNSSAAGPDWAGVVPAYRARARRLAARYDVPYLHVERGVDLHDDDFADLFHLLAHGRAKWQPEMARQLAAALRAPGSGPLAAGPESPRAAAPAE